MNAVSHRLPVLVLATGLMLACGPAAAQQSQVVGGLVVNMGLVPAEVALRADGHREAHQAHPPAGPSTC